MSIQAKLLDLCTLKFLFRLLKCNFCSPSLDLLLCPSIKTKLTAYFLVELPSYTFNRANSDWFIGLLTHEIAQLFY